MHASVEQTCCLLHVKKDLHDMLLNKDISLTNEA